MGGLPDYTQKTRRGISARAINVRNAFNLAKSPERLLLEELPQAAGFSDIYSMKNDDRLEELSQVLIEVFRELKNAYGKLLKNQKELLAQAFNIDPNLPLNDLRKVLSSNYDGLENYTIDKKGLRALLMRITKSQINEEEWLENVLMFLGNKPSSKWQDSDRDFAEYRLTDFSRRIIDLEKMRLNDRSRSSEIIGDFDVYLLRSIKKGGDIKEEVVAVNKDSAKRISRTKEKIRESLNDLVDKELMLGALAEMVDEFLTNYKERQSDENEHTKMENPRLVDGALE